MKWEEEYDKLADYADNYVCFIEIKQFITDLRKKDKEELIKMLPVQDSSEKYDSFYGEGFNNCLNQVKQLIKEYYQQ